jgi:tetratricopeptide (TPR) repeat protein
MAMKGQIDEAVSLAVKDPLAAEAALNTLMAAADTNIVNRKISDAMAALNAAQNFLDALEKTGQFKKLPREALMGRQLRVQGILLNDQKQYPKAVEVLRQALTISQRAQDPALDAGIHNNLGYALQYQGLVEDAIKEFEAARKIAEEQKDDLRAGSYNYNLGTALLDGSHSQEAQEAFKRSAAQNKVAGRTNLEARAIMMQGVAAGKMNPLAEDALKFFKDA